MANILLLSASARLGGHTDQLMQYLGNVLEGDWINMSEKNIGYYDYNHANIDDDFIGIAEKMTQASHIVLGTPVYWYSMSARMKTFLDRWSDLVTVRKDLGRALKDKAFTVVSCGSWEQSGEGFALPFKQTAGYMDMTYGGHFHTWIGDGEKFENESVQKRFNLLAESLKNNIQTK